MALSWVMVVRGDGSGVREDVFIDGNYVDTAGPIAPTRDTSIEQLCAKFHTNRGGSAAFSH